MLFYPKGLEEKSMKLTRRSLLANGAVGATVLSISPNYAAFAQSTCGGECRIWAGQTYDAGKIIVTNDQTKLVIDIDMSGLAVFAAEPAENLKIWAGTDLSLVPVNPQGIPVPGNFPFKFTIGANSSTAHVEIPLQDAGVLIPFTCPTTLYLFVHLDVKTNSGSEETAWAGRVSSCTGNATGFDNPSSVPRWYYYLSYNLCCDTHTDLGGCQTAFAKGGYVWTTDPKSNPDKLPSLKLTKNRWGWAINLTATGTTSYPIFAGAGLNDTAKGTKVGTLIIVWDGSVVSVKYDLDAPYRLSSVHLYAGDSAPTTIAPGQYGNIESFAAKDNKNDYEFVGLPLVDANGGGVWIVAHAVVCDAEPA